MRKINPQFDVFFFKDDPNSSANTRSGQNATGGNNMCFYVCISKLLTFELANTHSSYLDGARKPWDRANSADRSMASRSELEAAQLDSPLKYDN